MIRGRGVIAVLEETQIKAPFFGKLPKTGWQAVHLKSLLAMKLPATEEDSRN